MAKGIWIQLRLQMWDCAFEGQSALGQPITIEANAVARFELNAATWRISTPEIDVAEGSRWSDDFRIPVGVPLRARMERTLSLSRGTSATATSQVTIAKAGYYRIVVSVDDPDFVAPTGALVQTAVQTELWLYVDEGGGRVTQTFKPELLPPGSLSQPGPFRASRPNRPKTPPQSRVGPGVALFSDGNDYHRLVYWNTYAGVYTPVPNAKIEYRFYREEYGNTVLISEGTNASGSDGMYTIECNVLYEGEWYESNARLINGLVSISNHGPDGWAGGPGGSDCGVYNTAENPLVVVVQSNPANVFRNMTLDIALSRQFFQNSRGFIPVKVLSTNGTSFYSTLYDEITVHANSVWGQAGRFVAAHEYGHALHEKGLGGIEDYSCPSTHHNDEYTSLGCAFAEGFATYHATAIGAALFDLESSDYTYGCTLYDASHNCLSRASARDGSVVEGAVASFLFDLSDAANESADPVQYPGQYVADLVRTCFVYGSIPYRIRGADFMAYCLEQQVDAYIRSNYFTTRTFSVSTVSEGAQEPPSWSRSEIQTVWKWTLYRQ